MRRQLVTFKINFSTGVLLQSTSDQRIIYFHAWNSAESNTDFLFDEPKYIRTWHDARRLVDEVTIDLIVERSRTKRPNSDFKVSL